MIWRPWVLDRANPADDATRGVNTRDNQEQVTVPDPELGTWRDLVARLPRLDAVPA